jgi:aspartyl-tRNA(Asn)/glutamyl-tRNA(Gln) amidotransferase subunit C
MAAPKITLDDVLHVARLAALEFTEDELPRFGEQLGAIVAHIAELDTVDTATVEPTSHPLDVTAPLRADAVAPSLRRAEVLAVAPAHDAGCFAVPRVLDVTQGRGGQDASGGGSAR